jgi:hypothetical protein
MATIANVTTAEALLAAGDIGRCELVRGELIMMSPAGSEHGWVVMNIGGPVGGVCQAAFAGEGFWGRDRLLD